MTTRLWFEDELRRLLMRGGLAESPPNLRVKLFYTGSVEDAEAQIVSGLAFREQEKSDKAADVAVASDSSDVDSDPDLAKPLDLAHISGRPDLGVAITSEVRSSGSQERTGVFVCGPLSMQHDVSNAVASEQLGLVKDGSKEVYLHVEHFSWA